MSSNLPSTYPPASSPERTAVPETWVEEIFERLTAQLGAKVADLWANADPGRVKAEWAEALGSFDPSEIKRGLAATRARTFAPTLGEFLRLCRPALDPEVAWLEAVDGLRARDRGERGDWTHPGVYRAARDMQHEVRTGSFREHRKRWEWLLARELGRGFLLGVPDAPKAIEHGEVAVRGPNEAERQALASLRERIAPRTEEPQA